MRILLVMPYKLDCYHLHGRITKVTVSTGSTSSEQTRWFYDGEGRRVREERWTVGGGTETIQYSTVFVYDPQGGLVAEYDSRGPQDSAGTTYLTTDHLGSTRLVTKGTGQTEAEVVASRRDYLPFGEEVRESGGTGPKEKFTGKERSDVSGTRLDYFGARYLSAILGRFTAADQTTKAVVASVPQTWNGYSYGANNPHSFVDVNGEWPAYVHNEILDLAFGGVLPGSELRVLKKVNLWMDFASGQQTPENSHQHAMCSAGTGSGCLGAIERFLSDRVQGAQSAPNRIEGLGQVGKALHTITDWSSPAHVDGSGQPLPWNDPPVYSKEMRAHFAAEATADVNPSRFYLGVRLAVGIYLAAFPQEAPRFKNLETRIINDARFRAFRTLTGGDPRGSRGYPSQIEMEALAQC